MNLLIARMGSKYSVIDAKSEETWGLERAKVIIDAVCGCPFIIQKLIRLRIKPVIHIATREIESLMTESSKPDVKMDNFQLIQTVYSKTTKLEENMTKMEKNLNDTLSAIKQQLEALAIKSDGAKGGE